MKIKWKPLIISLLISFGVEIISGLLTTNSMSLYKELNTPPLSPPGWVFPIVWTILFFLMGISAYLIYTAEEGEKTQALRLYAIQLIVNVGWSIIFFRMEAYLFAFVWLILLWILVFNMIKSFWSIDELAAKLQIPYLLWLTFAAYLNLFVYFLN